MESITVKHLLNGHKAEIEKQLGYLVNVSKRLKLTAPTWEFSDVYEHEFAIEIGFNDENNGHQKEDEIYIENCFDVTIHVAETLKIDGDWIFACAIDHRSKAMIQVDENTVIPLRYNPSNDCCEHCGKKYPRVRSYVVLNEKNGEFKQVGKGCLKQFLGINPASYITMFEAVSKFSPVVKGFGRKNSGGRMDDLAYNVSDMLRYTIHQLAKDNGVFVKPEWEQIVSGYDWRGEERFINVRSNQGEATLDKVKDRLFAIGYFRMNPNALNDGTTVEQLEERLKYYSKRLDLYKGHELKYGSRAYVRSGEIKYSISEIKNHIHAVKYKMLVDETILPYTEEVEAVKAFANDLVIAQEGEANYNTSFEQYKQLVKNVFLKDRTLQSNLKTIVSGYNYYTKQVERAKQDAIRKANAVNLKHVGAVGEKSELVLKVIDIKYGEGAYGTWKLWKLQDESGNLFSKFGEISKKFTIIESEPDSESDDVNIGSTISVTAMIKEHSEYREEKTTMLGILSKTKKAPYIYETKKAVK